MALEAIQILHQLYCRFYIMKSVLDQRLSHDCLPMIYTPPSALTPFLYNHFERIRYQHDRSFLVVQGQFLSWSRHKRKPLQQQRRDQVEVGLGKGLPQTDTFSCSKRQPTRLGLECSFLVQEAIWIEHIWILPFPGIFMDPHHVTHDSGSGGNIIASWG